MEENSANSPALIDIPENNIRVVESNIHAQLDSFEKGLPDTNFLETSDVCDNIRDQILYYGDEPHLSKTQNNCRRIFIASELFISICTIYEHIVDNEFTRIINDMVQWEKYKKLSKKIMHKVQIETKKENYFAKEAESKLLKSLEDIERRSLEEEEEETEQRDARDLELVPRQRGAEQVTTSMGILEQTPVPMEYREIEVPGTTLSEREVLPSTDDFELIGTFAQAAGQEISETRAQPLESASRDDIISSTSANLTEMRVEPPTDTSRLHYPISDMSRLDLSLPITAAETSIREPVAEEKIDDDVSRILQILEDQIFQGVGEIVQPIEPRDESAEVQEVAAAEELRTDYFGKQTDESERSEEWSLPSIDEPAEKSRKKRRLIIDNVTIIPEYAARALHLNRNINIQRVQVFEGPPEILQGISVNHLMKTPGFKSSLFKDVRSSRLNALYNRHLVAEKKPVESIIQRRVTEEKREDVPKVRTIEEIIEVKERAGMHLELEKSILTEVAPDKSRQGETEIPVAAEVPQKESLIGLPISRIITSTIEPPKEAEMEIINAAPILPTPRAQQLQGKSIEPITTSTWFFSSKQNPPSEKYREFNYVYKKLREYWSLFEIQGIEKRISLREFFSFEEEASVANYLTTLRIVDKMSIQRKVLLEYKNNDVFIRPFESPYVSDGQLLLKGMKPLL